ncbi:hypothetical protein MW7_007410 [Imbroritus primus]|uniref:Uncharacterized protein n=1 Tax=Imbroritus primus TaxID=3058603 RepID=A0ACD3SQT1_9BURK|nr:hypothetical protein MW7_007410 [Burkholderiaceae bacterium PBA]
MSVYDALELPPCDMRVRAVVAATYLQAHGFTEDQLRALHHLKGETFVKFLEYFSRERTKEAQLKNAQYTTRVIFIAERHAANEATFDELVAEALERWPL